MPVSTAPKPGEKRLGFAHQPGADQKVGDARGTREKRRPGKTDNDLRQRQNRKQTDQPDRLHLSRLPGQKVGERKSDLTQQIATVTASISEKPSTVPKKAERNRA